MSDQVTALQHEITRLREKNRQLKARLAGAITHVTTELVGEENLKAYPFCHRAVMARLPISDFIAFLLGENQQLTTGLNECEKYRNIPYPIAVDSEKFNQLTTAIADSCETVLVNGCHDCPFRQSKTCHFVGFVTNEWRDESFHDRCPLHSKSILVMAKN